MPVILDSNEIKVIDGDKNFTIETVKSNVIVNQDTLINQPVVPILQLETSVSLEIIDETYKYMAFTHSGGSENQTEYSVKFNIETECDILIVGGGGGGGKRHGGGGGAGTLIYHKGITLNGDYTIKVGKGGNGIGTGLKHPSHSGTNGATDGQYSEFVKQDGTQRYLAVGGGRGTTSGSTYATTNGGQGFLNTPLTLSSGNYFNGNQVSVSNQQYVNTGLTYPEGCRGNMGGIQITNYRGGGGGGAGIVGMNHDAETTPDDGYGGNGIDIDITGTSVIYAGGGGGADFNGSVAQVYDPNKPTIELRGGGGYGSDTGSAQNGLNGTGGGGGGQGNDSNFSSGNGGSGIVIIRYKVGDAGTMDPQTLTHYTPERMYPPTRNLASASHLISGESYGNGVYETSSSTAFDSYLVAYTAFKTSDITGFAAAEGQYNTGSYIGTNYIVSGYNGDWIKIKLPRPIKLTKYGFKQRTPSYSDRAPGKYKLYGSNDGTNWDVLVHKITTVSYTQQISVTNDYFEENINVNNQYQYFGLVTNELKGNTSILNFDEWYIYGKEFISEDPEYKLLTFEYQNNENNQYNQTEYTLNVPEDTECDILIVGGGGGGGDARTGGGGGAGGLVYATGIQLNGTYNIKVGKGGLGKLYNQSVTQPYNNGSDSGIYNSNNDIIYQTKGGGAGGDQNITGSDGGSGGGGGGGLDTTAGLGGNSIITGDYNGSIGYSGGIGNRYQKGGGGGGAGGVGQPATGSAYANGVGGSGGDGVVIDITGSEQVYAAGGGGGTWQVTAGLGGGGIINGNFVKVGGSGARASGSGENAVSHTGSGGGGGATSTTDNGGNGGSGIVIILYKTQYQTTTHGAQWTYYSTNPNTHHYGNVGIGTVASATQKLLVNGDMNVTGNYKQNDNTICNWYTNGTDVYRTSGNVGIGNTAPQYSLHVHGGIYAGQGGTTGNGSTTWTVTSDSRMKDNIFKVSYKECYEIFKKIELYRYNFKPGYVNSNDRNQLGFIAQEVQQQLPRSVEPRSIRLTSGVYIHDILTLNVTQINYILYGTFKYLIAELDIIKKHLEGQEEAGQTE
jgi:hypothetical protein